jgi:prevent-host-death family protein
MVVTMSRRWNIAAAKAELSRVVKRAQREPQILENRGRPVAVVVAPTDFKRLAAGQDAAARMAEFLEFSESLGRAHGWDLELPARAPRPSPFRRAR